ncbi:MAG: VWA domain-containing protein [Planctomycetota bacterium]
MQATTLMQLGLASAGLALLAWGPPRIAAETEVELRTEQLGPEGLRPLEGRERTRALALHERLILVGQVTRADLEQLPLAPDPGALRTRVRPSVPFRVLDPDAISVRALRAPRLGRPLGIELAVHGARPADRVVLAGQPDLVLGGSLADGRFRAEHEFSELGSRLRITVRWAGVRAGRRGLVTASFELKAAAEPRFYLAESLRRPEPGKGPIDRGLRLQGFRRVPDPEEAELLVLSLCRPAPEWLERRLDRGAGCLLVAEPGRNMHPSMLAFAPVLPARTGSLAPAPEPAGSGTAGRQPGQPGGPGGPEPPGAAKGKPPGQVRPGQPSAVERAEALRRATEPGEKVRSVALVLVVDNSGSMSEFSRIEMARKGAWATASKLGRGDQLALISFGSRARLLLPLGPARDLVHRSKLKAALEGLDASEGATNCFPALEKAWAELKRAAGRDPIRHVVVLTDGAFTDLIKDYPGVLGSMTRQGIGITGLGIYQEEGGLGAAQFVFLDKILASVGGHLVLTKRATEIPELLLGEVELISGAMALEEDGGAGGKALEPGGTGRATEERSGARAGAAKEARRFALHPVDLEPVLAGLETVSWPSVAGYLPLEAQIRTRVHLSVGAGGHVFLATSPFGLGRVAVLAGSDGAPWCTELSSRVWYPRLLGQLAAWLLPQGPEEPDGPAGRHAFRRVSSRILEGDGVQPGVPALVAALVAGSVEELPSPRISSIEIRRAGPVWPWLAALLLGFFLVLVFERARSRA